MNRSKVGLPIQCHTFAQARTLTCPYGSYACIFSIGNVLLYILLQQLYIMIYLYFLQ